MDFNAIRISGSMHLCVPRKTLLVMKITTFLLLMTIMTVSANSLAQKITLNEKNSSLEQVLNKIRQQSGYDFVYSEDLFLNASPITVTIKDATLDEALKASLKYQALSFKIENGAVLFKVKEETLFDKIKSALAAIDIHGKVVDENGGPLVGATVTVKGGVPSTTTNANGEFSLLKVDEKAILQISFIGYELKEITANANLSNIKLEVATAKLSEVKINAGYYSVTDLERTGNISKIDASVIEKQPINNVLMGLQGRVPGLQITQNTGIPGGGFTIRIRGQNSISSGNEPLYIIDGVIYSSTKPSSNVSDNILTNSGANPLSLINPTDIASVEILKDADATAIYGSKGANGVILITTKKGVSGSTKVSAAISHGLSQVGHKMDLLNTQQYVQMRKEALSNDALAPSSTAYDVNGTWDLTKNTDWQKELIGGSSNLTNASLSIGGGGKNSNYLISANYYDEGTVFPGDFGFNRASIHSSLNIGSPDDRLQTNFTFSYSHSKSNLLGTDLTSLILLAPNHPDPYDQYGNLNWSNNTVFQNPMAYLLATNNSGSDNLVGNIVLKYNILKNLNIKLSVGYNSLKRNELSKQPLASFSPVFGLTSTSRSSYFTDNFNNSWIAEPQINYSTKIGPGELTSLIGFTVQGNNVQYRTIYASGFNSDEFMENIGSASLFSTNQSSLTQYRYTAVFARLNYAIDNKYFLNVTARRDGSSRFGSGKQFANFGAVGAAWVFSKEKLFAENLQFLSFGKLRASYGVTGNDQIPDYGYLQLWNTNQSGSYQGVSTIAPTRISNSNFGWETNQKAEVALQLGFLRDKVNLEISYYLNKSSNQLVGQTLPFITGFNSIQANLPATVQNKGWEFDADIKILTKKNWRWSVGVNLTLPSNKLLAYPGLEASSDAINYLIGQPLNIRKIYNTSVNSQTGLYTMQDYNGNGALDIADRYLYKFIGQQFYGGFQNSIQFKEISFDFLFSYTKQTGSNYLSTIRNSPGYYTPSDPFANQPSQVLTRWQKVGDQTNVQKFSTTVNSAIQFLNAKGNGGIAIGDASYIRLKNISLTYNLPKKWLKPLKISDAAIDFQGQNVFTITKFIGLDPESQSTSTLPPLRTFLIGLKVTF